VSGLSGGGSAGPDTLYTFIPTLGEPPSSNYATLDTRNDRPVLDFDASTDEAMHWTFVLPERYDGGGVTLEIHVMATSATSNDFVFGAAFEKLAGQDLDSDGFATAQTATVTVNGTSGVKSIATITFTDGAQMDSVGAGEAGRVKIYRDADNGSDDATGDAEYITAQLKETS
jgi:hypothetical protein